MVKVKKCKIDKLNLGNPSKLNNFRGFKSNMTWSVMFIVLGILLLSAKVDGNNKKCAPVLPEPEEHTYAIYNAKILTYTKESVKYYDSMVISNGKFKFVGDYNKLNDEYPNIKKYNLNGYTVQPGLIDAHAHLLGRGRQLLQVDLRDSKSIEIIKEKIAYHYLNNEKIPFIQGYGWDQNLFANPTFPTYKDLEFDEAKYPGLNDYPISLTRIDGHGSWINKAALDLLIKNNTQILDPNFKIEGGDIIRDNNSYPTGILIDNARALITKLIPSPTENMELNALDNITKEMLSNGLTGAHDAGISPKELNVFKKALNKDELNIRVHSMIMCRQEANYCDEQSLKSIGVPEKDHLNKHKLSFRSIKVILDGAIGSWGAAMLEPYSDKNTTGLITYDEEILRQRMKVWSKMGLQINSHAIGDKANRVALDNYEYLIKNNIVTKQQLKQQRHRIEHAQILTAADIPRFAKLGIIPSMQPTHATSDMAYVEKRVGPSRIKYGYAWKSLIDSGVQVMPFSSDFPVEKVDPRLGIHAAITRTDKDGNSPHGPTGWYKKEGVSALQALKGFTIEAAKASFKENEVGSIEINKLADFIIVKKSWLDISPKELLLESSKVRATFLGGKRVF